MKSVSFLPPKTKSTLDGHMDEWMMDRQTESNARLLLRC